MKLKAFALCALILLPAVLHGQTVLNPTMVEFQVSPDHNVTYPDGIGIVTDYELQIFAVGAQAPMTRVSLGKPQAADGATVSLSITDTIVGMPVSPSVTYVARVSARGPSGEGVSDPSNPFAVVAAPRAPVGAMIVRR